MAAQGIRLNLQRDVFTPNNEILETFVHVTKTAQSRNVLGKKKKDGSSSQSFLCISVRGDKLGAVISQVKRNEKNTFTKKRTWNLAELRLVDGKSLNKEILEFDITFDKVYTWAASNKQERFAFITTLSRLCDRYMPKQKPVFENFPDSVFDVPDQGPESKSPLMSMHSFQSSIDEDIVSPQEEADLDKLLSESQIAVNSAEAFTSFLTNKLSLLDHSNIKQLIGSEFQVVEVLSMLEKAEAQAAVIESVLTEYETILQEASSAMSSVGKTISLQTTHQNYRSLLSTLESLIEQLDISTAHQSVINNPDLTPGPGLDAVREAAKALRKAAFANFPEELKNMKGVTSQFGKVDRLKKRLSQSVQRYMSNSFIHFGNDYGETVSQHSHSSRSSNLSLHKHSHIHNQLSAYMELVHWMKAMDPQGYSNLLDTYTLSMAKLYERSIGQFFEEARAKIFSMKERKLKGSESGSNIGKKAENVVSPGSTPTQPQSLLGVDKDQWSVEVDMNDRKKFDELLENVLSELEPVCLSEQEFSVVYFLLDPTQSANLESGPIAKQGKQASDETRRIMSKMFTTVEQELSKFIAYYEKLDSFYVLYALVRFGQHVLSAQDTGSFLSVTFGSVLVQIKRAFDRFMLAQIKSVEEAKAPKRSKCGILPVVSNFEDFAGAAEVAFRGWDRRVDLDKWYTRLVKAIFEATLRISKDHGKTPHEVIKMENFHYFHRMLSRLKISALDNEKKEAKQRYNEALEDYVSHYFGRPLVRLNTYFERVHVKVNQGVKEAEISYQAQFSKQELRKVISEYPGKEVKKGLESLYKKVDKDLSEEANLLQIVWRAMQEEFVHQYKVLEEMIQRCYPGALISLEFTIDDILAYFSDIAQSH